MNLHRFRRLLFWTFVLGFLATASLVLFYAFGYRFNFSRGIFVYSGSITVKSLPQNVTVKIDGETVPEQRLGLLNNSIHVAGLMPGEHFIEVSSSGYVTWSKKVIVGSGVSTEFWNVALTKENYTTETLSDTAGTVRVFPDTKSRLLALVKKVGDETSVVVLDRTTGEKKEVYATREFTFNEANPDGLLWSPDRKKLLLPLWKGDTSVFVIVDRESGEAFPLSDLFTAHTFTAATWDENEKYTVLFIADHNFYRLNLNNGKTPEFLMEKVGAFDISGDYIYIAREEDGMVLRFRSGTAGDRLDQVSLSSPTSFNGTPFSLSVYDSNRLALLEREGKRRLFVYNNGDEKNYGFQELGENVSRLEFSDDGKKLLFWNNNEMNVYFFRAWNVQPERKENSIIQIARFSDRIANVEWTEDYEHVLFSQGANVKMIELDNRDRRAISNILMLEDTPLQIFPLFSNNHLFFVLPEKDIASITFPQPQGLFGQ